MQGLKGLKKWFWPGFAVVVLVLSLAVGSLQRSSGGSGAPGDNAAYKAGSATDGKAALPGSSSSLLAGGAPGNAGQSFGGEVAADSSAEYSKQKSSGDSSQVDSTQVKRMIVYDRTLSLQVADVRKTASQAEKTALSLGGYIQSMNFDSSSPQPLVDGSGGTGGTGGTRPMKDARDALEGTVVVRLPASKLPLFGDKLKAMGTVLDESGSANEVTDHYVDLNARLKNLRREETRLLEIFDSASRVSDMLAVENQLNRIRGEIESMTAQKKQIEKSVALATFTLNLQKKTGFIEPAKSDWGFDETIKLSVETFVSVVQSLMVGFATLLPFILLGVPLYLGFRYLKKRRAA